MDRAPLPISRRSWLKAAVPTGLALAGLPRLALGGEEARPAGPAVVSADPGDSPVLRFARELANGRAVRATIRHDGSDAYRFRVASDGAIEVECGHERGVLYAVYDVLAGRTEGDHQPAFSIRGLFPCDALQRFTPDMVRTFIDRMGRWRMNTLPVITHYGYREFASLIDDECAKRGIDVVHYTYYQFAFCDQIPPQYFSVNAEGKPLPPYTWLENEDRLCASNPEGLKLYRQGVRRYLDEHPDRRQLTFATPDGLYCCQCENCRRLGPEGQAMPFFEIFMEESQGRDLWREFLVYFQRYEFPHDMTRIAQLDAIMFDDHTRNPFFPLHDPELKAGDDWGNRDVDPRARETTANRYLFDRLVEWRHAFSGKLYLHENLMIQGAYGVPRLNTPVYLEDLKQFQKLGVDGVVYEAFECGIRPFLPSFDVLAQALWQPSAEYAVHDDANPELHEYYRVVNAFNAKPSWSTCRELMDYLLARPDREQFDWLFVGYNSMMRTGRQHGLPPGLTEEERELITKRKLWDFMEGRPQARERVGQLLTEITQKLAAER